MDIHMAIDCRSRGMNYDARAIEFARDNGLLGGEPDPEYDKQSRMDASDSLTIKEKSFPDKNEISVAELWRNLEAVDEMQTSLTMLVQVLQDKLDHNRTVTAADIDEHVVAAAEVILYIRGEQVEEFRRNNSQFVAKSTEWIENGARQALIKKGVEKNQDIDFNTALQLARIDAADRLIIELNSEFDDSEEDFSGETQTQLQIVIAERNKLLSHLNAGTLKRYLALAA